MPNKRKIHEISTRSIKLRVKRFIQTPKNVNLSSISLSNSDLESEYCPVVSQALVPAIKPVESSESSEWDVSQEERFS